MSYAPSAALNERHRVLRREMAARSLDALIVTALPNVLYLTNFTGSAAIVVVTADRVCFLTDFRYLTALEGSRGTPRECPGLDVVEVAGSYDRSLADLVTTLTPGRAGRVGFEAADLTVARHAWLTETLAGQGSQAGLVATEGIVESLRIRKDAYEIATLREAARRLSGVAQRVLAEVRPGVSETEFAFTVDTRIHEAGFSRTAFDTIVAGGPNSALPHARPGERILSEGDLVVLDFGGVYRSYCVDLTRTVSLGPASPRTREVYEAVRRAHAQAIAAVAPGRSRFDIDAAARQSLTESGLGEAFGHGTGHGLGIEVHENPRVAQRRPDVDPQNDAVTSGMVFTIEPGAYLAGWGGVRIEDDVLVTDDGVDVLTDVTTDLIEIRWT
ncbi:MAG: aminopeptidase P family protein [Acidobacteria bacterium]|nr:aminopeptidase P family protein [Acidobacteriota bacterium]